MKKLNKSIAVILTTIMQFAIMQGTISYRAFALEDMPQTTPVTSEQTSPDTTPEPEVTPQPTPEPTPTPQPTPVPEKYTVQFMLENGQVLQTQTVESGKQVQRPVNPTKDNYNFDGWYLVDGSGNLTIQFDFNSQITSNTLVYAKFSAKTFNIQYILDGSATNNNPNQYIYGKGVAQFNDAVWEEHTFDGWYSDSNYQNRVTSISSSQSGDITLYGKMSKKSYKVEYVLNGGTNDSRNPTSYNLGDYYKIYPATRQGYTFGGWFENEDFTSQRTSVDKDNHKDYKLYAKWIADEYVITYNLNGGQMSEDAARKYQGGVGLASLPTPYRQGYVFNGWYSDPQFKNSISQISSEQTGDIIIYASWTADSMAISYNLNGGTNNPGNPNSYKVGQQKIELLEPTRDGYRFVGWFSDSGMTQQVYFIDGTQSNMTLYAKWEYIGASGQSETPDESASDIDEGGSGQNKSDKDNNKKDDLPVYILVIIWVAIMAVLGVIVIAVIYYKHQNDDFDDNDDGPDDNGDGPDNDDDGPDDGGDGPDDDGEESDGNDYEYSNKQDKYNVYSGYRSENNKQSEKRENVDRAAAYGETWISDVNLSDIVEKGKKERDDTYAKIYGTANIDEQADDFDTKLDIKDEDVDFNAMLDDLGYKQ